MSLTSLSLTETHDGLVQKKFKVSEVVQAYLNRIESIDSRLNSFITVCGDQALAQAKKLDDQKPEGLLWGCPLAPKDIYLTHGVRTTCASRILENFIPPYNSTVIDRCLEQGAVILGKVNLDEFAMGSSTENSAYGITRNPWNLDHVPGGSSGGSAAAVAADLCAASLGTDTGGSIRQPASHCGIVGLKPTYGRVSRYGTIAFASSLDQMGPMTKTVSDAALLMQVMAGHDVKDSTSSTQSTSDYLAALTGDIRGLKVGVPQEYFSDAVDEEVKSVVHRALETLKNLGAVIKEVSLPHTEYAVATYYIIAPAEASANLARFDGVRFGLRENADGLNELYEKTKAKGFGSEVKRRILIGTYVLSSGYYDAYYVKAQKARTVIQSDFTKVFQDVDVIVGPVAPTTAFKIGEESKDPMKMYLSDVLTVSVNMAGLPGISVPCGFDSRGLPVGLQIIGRAFDEATILKTAHAYEQAQSWFKEKPKLS